MPLSIFFLGNAYVGAKSITREQYARIAFGNSEILPDHNLGPTSKLFVCPCCGEVWARLLWEVTTDDVGRWHSNWVPVLEPCRTHGGGRLFKAITTPALMRYLELYPDEALSFDLEIQRSSSS